jgi:hypothetical protein
MPIIIAVHIPNSRAMCRPSQTAVIIHADGPVMGPSAERSWHDARAWSIQRIRSGRVAASSI